MNSSIWLAILVAGFVFGAAFICVLIFRMNRRISRYDEQVLAPESETDLRAQVTTKEGET